jgi:hypothetical protein
MFYNARYYSSYLNRWIQPDTIVPDPASPQSLNRFAYTVNNPVRNVDPSGHCGADASERLTEDCETVQTYLEGYYHLDITGMWRYAEMLLLQLALGDIASGLGGQAYFIEIYALAQINRERVWQGSQGEAAHTTLDGKTINVFNEAFAYGKDLSRWAAIHELVHVWDIRSDLDRSDNALTPELTNSHMNAVSAYCIPGTDCGFGSYDPDDIESPFSAYAYWGPMEDAAETMTGALFGGNWLNLQQNHPSGGIVGDISSRPIRASWASGFIQEWRRETTVSFSHGQ